MTNNEIKEQKTRQMARVISMATSLHYAIEELMSMMIAEWKRRVCLTPSGTGDLTPSGIIRLTP